MPYENDHACLVNPNITEILGTQTRKHNGKSYKVRIGRAKGQREGSAERSYLYPISEWTKAQAQAHCREHDGRFEPAVPKKTQEMNVLDPDKNKQISTICNCGEE